MPFHLFKSKRPVTSKCNTIKKPEPPKAQSPRQRDINSENENHVVDITNVGTWVKENAVNELANDRNHGGAVLRGKGPDRATLVSELDATQTVIDAQKAIEDEVDSGEEPRQQEMVELVLGKQDSSSSYFTRRCIILPELANPSFFRPNMPTTSTLDRLDMMVPDLDPHAFELYQIWLHTGVISPRCQIPYDMTPESGHRCLWRTYWPLFNAHILGCRIDTPNFADEVMDLLEDKLSGSSSPDIDTIQHLFTKEGDTIPKVLRDFVADQYVDANVRGLADIDTTMLPLSFLRLTLERTFLRLSKTPTTYASGCRYHTHATPELCYKQSIPPQDLRRKERLELERQKASNDAKEVMRVVKNNGVKTVDWEERRAEAIRAMTLQ
ncbi:hypothetical protein IQ06DRAFT_201388, partial [Phaeosphaeriaceae sp. SRC1lsM3a]